MTPAEENTSLKHELEKMRDDLQRTAEEIRLKLHLAGMDAKDAWTRLEPQLKDFEKRVEGVADAATQELKGFGSDLKERAKKLRDQVV